MVVNSVGQSSTPTVKIYSQQECIPVGCVLSAAVARGGGVCPGAVSAQRVRCVCLGVSTQRVSPREVSAQGVSAQEVSA